jgi:hypothetical protein
MHHSLSQSAVESCATLLELRPRLALVPTLQHALLQQVVTKMQSMDATVRCGVCRYDSTAAAAAVASS